MSLLLAATPLADDGQFFPPFIGDTWLPDEVAQPDYHVSFEVILCGPLEDTAVTEDAYAVPVLFDDLADELATQEPGFWATAPPGQDDDWVGAVVLEAADADQEADYGFTVSPPDQDDDEPLSAYLAQDDADADADPGDVVVLGPTEDEPVVLDDSAFEPVILDDSEPDATAEAADWYAGPLDDAPSVVTAEPDRGKGSWDPYYYKRRKKRKKDKAELETYLAETAGPVPAPIRDEVADARAAAIRALESDEPTFLGEAVKAINRADAAARLAAKQAALADEEEDEEILLLWS